MVITVSGKNVDTGIAFQEHSRDRLNDVVAKYFQNAVSGHVTLDKDEAIFTVRIRVNLTNRMEMEATGSARDAHSALDMALEHSEKRLRRHKRRLKNHRPAPEQDEVLQVPMAIYAGVDSHFDESLDEPENDEDEALPVIAELSYEVEILSVDQAVMRLELSRESCLLFRHAGHLGLNMVYVRADGTIGWVDPRGTRQLATSHGISSPTEDVANTH